METQSSGQIPGFSLFRASILTILSALTFTLLFLLLDVFTNEFEFQNYAPQTYSSVWVSFSFLIVLWIGAKLSDGLGQFILGTLWGLLYSLGLGAVCCIPFILASIDIVDLQTNYYGVCGKENIYPLTRGIVYHRNSPKILSMKKLRKTQNLDETVGLRPFRTIESAIALGYWPDIDIAPESFPPPSLKDHLALIFSAGPNLIFDTFLFLGSILIPGLIIMQVHLCTKFKESPWLNPTPKRTAC